MTVTLLLPAVLRACAGGQREVAVESAGTLRDAFDDLARRLPVLDRRIRDEQGVLRPHVMVYVDGVSVRGAADLDTPVHEGTEVFIAPAVSGG